MEYASREFCEVYAETLREKGYTAKIVPTGNGFVVEYNKKSAAMVKLEKEFEAKSRR